MDLKRIAKDTTQVLTSYLTYQAVRTVLSQLLEANLPLFHQLNNFASREKLQDGEAFISDLLQEHTELAFRIMTVRQHLAEEVAEFLPEMLTTNIQQANMGHRKRQLEKMTQMTSEELTASADKRESDTNLNDSSDIRSAQPDERSSDLPDTEPLDPA
ncbi:MAG: chaperonin family protein RbcX [Phormidesmis sp.]